MNFRDSLAYLDSLANLEKIRILAGNRLLNLDRMHYLVNLFGHPEKQFFPVLIVGTKGKGSTGFFLQSILNAAGISAGFYSSPHLETPLERIRLRGRQISVRLWTRTLGHIKKTLDRHPLPGKLGQMTYFEALTLAALLVFREEGMEVGVLEAGLGGRLDAVNAVDASLVIVTTVGLDHEEFLGNTVEKIAAEKAGVFRRGIEIITSPQKAGAGRVLRECAGRAGAKLREVRPARGLKIGLRGEFQKNNAAAALEAARLTARALGKQLPEKALRQGLRASQWPARVEVFPGKPEVILDAAHNPDSALALTEALRKLKSKPTCLVFGVSRDKNSAAMLKSLSRAAHAVVLSGTNSPRAKGPGELLAEAQRLFEVIVPSPGSSREAFRTACEMAGPSGRVVVTGSFYLAGEVRPLLTAGN